MPSVSQIGIDFWPTLSILAVISLLLFGAKDRRLALLALLAQYAWQSMQMNYAIYQPVSLVRLGLGVMLCLMLYLTAHHVEVSLRHTQMPEVMNRGFRLMAMALAALLAWGAWQRYPLPMVPETLGIACYWLGLDGLVLLSMSTEPFSMGLGLLTLVSAFEGAYLYNEQGLIVTVLVGIADIGIAMAIVLFAEMAIAERERSREITERVASPEVANGEAAVE